MPLSPRQQRFVDEFCVDQVATLAYRRAGYKATSERSAEASSSRLMQNPAVRVAIEARLAVLAKKTRVSVEEAWMIHANVARAHIGDLIDFSGLEPKLLPANKMPVEALRALKSVKVKR